MGYLNKLWSGWKKLAHKIGNFQSKVILSVFYLLLAPIGLPFSLFKDELKIKKGSTSTWQNKIGQSESLNQLSQQS